MTVKDYLLMKSEEFKAQAEFLAEVDNQTSGEYFLMAEAYYQQYLKA